MHQPPQGLRLVTLLGVVAGALPAPATGEPPAASFLGARSRAGPTVCVDSKSWQDSRAYECKDYQAYKYCDASGGPGDGWVPLWGGFGNYAGSGGQAASGACCACGGGKQEELPTCRSFACPVGYSVKTSAAGQHCTSLSCDGRTDMAACCDQGTDVRVAVDNIRVLIGQLQQTVSKDTAATGDAEAESVRAEAAGYRDGRIAQLKDGLAKERMAATSDANAWFARLTGHNGGDLAKAAQHEITAVGYMATKAAATTGEARANKPMLEESAKNVMDAFQAALSAWQSAKDVGGSATEQGLKEFADYYGDLNTTWPLVVQGVDAANAALDATTVPGQATRWSKETTRLTTDLAQMVDHHAKSVNAQVQAARNSADAALGITGENRGKVRVLEAMVDQAAKAME
mmetsp:Transcript_19643/g.52142  ORF Transcript_19643/g.52142 Transcript_19643/m.52142 type:complete len:402 (-) Transcript_19643:45-1250(-)